MNTPDIFASILAVILTAVVVCVVVGSVVRAHRAELERLRRLADERRGETICHFARSLDYRRLDTKVIRAVYEALQDVVAPWFPVRASDDLDQIFLIDGEDLSDLAAEIAGRCGRTLDGWERNPYYGKVATVSDLVEFLSALPRAQSS
jgi:hypothetical protein